MPSGGARQGAQGDRRLPVTLVVGLPGAGKSTLIASWLGARPAGERWVVLVNQAAVAWMAGRDPARGERRESRLVAVGGCACCSGQAAFEAALVRLLREGAWDRLLVELDGGGEPARFVDLLRSGAGRRHLALDEVVAVVDAAVAERATTGRTADLLEHQVVAADRIVLNRCGEAPAGPDCRTLAAAIASRPPFRRWVEPETGPGLPGAEGDFWSSRRWHSPIPDGLNGEWVLAHVLGGGRRLVGAPREGGPAIIAWRWPPDVEFDRASLVQLLEAWPALPGLLRGEAAFRTARDWYLWRFDGRRAEWAPTGWRRDSRIELSLDAEPQGCDRAISIVEAGLAAGTVRA